MNVENNDKTPFIVSQRGRDGYSTSTEGMMEGKVQSQGPAYASNAYGDKNNIIQFNDIVEAGKQSERLNEVTVQGQDLTVKFYRVMEDLKQHWRTSGSYVNLSKLVPVQNAAYDITRVSNSLSVYAIQSIKGHQTNEDNIGGDSVSVKDPTVTSLPSNYKFDLANIKNLEGTHENYVDRENISNDLDSLKKVHGMYDNFVQDFTATKNALLSNWESGGNRPYFEEEVKKFESSSAEYNDYFQSAINALQEVTGSYDRLKATNVVDSVSDGNSGNSTAGGSSEDSSSQGGPGVSPSPSPSGSGETLVDTDINRVSDNYSGGPGASAPTFEAPNQGGPGVSPSPSPSPSPNPFVEYRENAMNDYQ